LSDSSPTLGDHHRQRDATRRWQRNQRTRADRIQTLRNPTNGDLMPAAVSVIEFRRLTGLSHATVHRRIRDGTLKSVKLFGRRLIAWSEVARLRDGAP
jgi:hypothetical protein